MPLMKQVSNWLLKLLFHMLIIKFHSNRPGHLHSKANFSSCCKILNQVFYMKTLSVATSDFANTRLSICCWNSKCNSAERRGAVPACVSNGFGPKASLFRLQIPDVRNCVSV